MEDKQNKIIIGTAGVIIILLIASFAFFNKSTPTNTKITTGPRYEGEQSLEILAQNSSCPFTGDKVALAKCLTEKGWTMYGADWCPHCKAQKADFGDAFQFVHYVECPDNEALCNAKGVIGYPTWILELTSTATSSTQ
jgi:hypothetical protein